MAKMALPSEKIAIVATIDPDAYSAITAYSNLSDFVDASNFAQYMVVVQAGTIAASGTLDVKVRVSKSNTGANEADLTGYAITQLTTASNDKQAVINIGAGAVLGDGFTHFRVAAKNATAAADYGVLVLGVEPFYGPANENDLASVAEFKP